VAQPTPVEAPVMTTDRISNRRQAYHLATQAARSAIPHFPGILREEHDLVAMFGEEYIQARNDTARRRANLIKPNLGEETKK
jgi:protein-S-isoprenylcysteine O-methyltransferase Ste14